MKERKKRKKFNIKRTLMYLATYIVVTFGVALFMVINTSTTLSSGNKLNFTVPEPSALEQVISSITENENIEMNISVNINKDSQEFAKALIDANLQFGEELTDIKVAAGLTLTKDNIQINAAASYLDNTLYLSLQDSKYKLDVPTLVDAIGSVTQVFGIDLGEMLDSFDPSALGDIGNNVQKIDGGYVIELEFEGIVIDLTTDIQYNLQSALIKDISFGDYTIKVKANVVGRNNGKVVTAPEGEYVDLTDSLDIISSVANILSQDTFFNIKVIGDKFEFNGFVNIGSNFDCYGTLKVAGVDINVVYSNQVIYAEALGAKVKLELRDYAEYLDVLGYFGINTDIDLDEILSQVAQMSFDIIKDVQKQGNFVTINVNSDKVTEPLVFDLTGNKLNSFTTNIGGFAIELNTFDGRAELPALSGEYLDLKEVLPYVPFVADVLDSKAVEGTINVQYGDNNFNFDYVVNFKQELKVQLQGQVFGYDVQVNYQDNFVYLVLDEARFAISVDDIAELVSSFELTFDNNLQLTLSKQTNGIAVQIAEYLINVALNDNAVTLSTAVNNIQLTTQVKLSNKSIEIDSSIYNYLDIVTLGAQIKELLESKQVELSLSTTVADMYFVASVLVDFNDGLKVNATATVLEKDIVVIIENDEIYVTIDQSIKVKGNLSELPELINDIMDALQGGGSSLGAITIPTASVTFNSGILTLGISGFNVAVNLEHGIGDITLYNNDITVNATVDIDGNVKQVETVENKQQYDNDIKTIVPYVQAINKLLNSRYIKVVASIRVNKEWHNVNAYIDHTDNWNVEVSTKLLDNDIKVKYVNGNLYANAFGLKYYLTQADITEIIQAATNNLATFNVDLSGMQITSFVIREGFIQLTIGEDIYVYVTLTNGEFSSLQILYGNISAYIYLSYGIKHNVVVPTVAYTRLTNQFDVANIINFVANVIESKKVELDANIAIGGNEIHAFAQIDFASELAAYAQVQAFGYNANVYIEQGKIYINVADMIYLYGNLDDIPQLITELTDIFGLEFDISELKNYVSYIQYVGFKQNTLTFAKDNISVSATLSAQFDSVQLCENKDIYTNNIADIVPAVKAVKQLIETGIIGSSVTVNYNNNEYILNVLIDREDELKVLLNTTLADIDISAVYDGDLYLAVDSLKYFVSTDDITQILDKVKEFVDFDQFDIHDITISNFVLSSSKISLTINDKVDLTINLNNNTITNVKAELQNVEVTLALDYTYSSGVQVPQVSEYTNIVDQFDVLDIIDLAKEVIDNKQVKLDAIVTLGDTQLFAQVKLDYNDGLVAQAQISYNDYTVYVYVQDGNLYINVADMAYLYGSIDDTVELIKQVLQLFEIELNVTDAIDYINYLAFDNNTLSYLNGTTSVEVNVFAEQFEINKLESTANYTNNINNLLPYIKAVKTLLDSEKLFATIEVEYNDTTYNVDVKYINNDGNIEIELSTKIKGKDISIIYADNVVYLNLFGYKASINVDSDGLDEIKDAVFELFEVEGLDQLKEKFDISIDTTNLISNLIFTATQLKFTAIDSVDVTINLANDRVNTVRVELDELSALITLDYDRVFTIALADSYDCLNEKLDILTNARKVIDTYNAITSEYEINGNTYIGYDAAFDAHVRFGNTVLQGHIELSVIPTQVGDEVENKIYASVAGSYGGLNAYIYLVDKTLYVNIQGLKIKLDITREEIDNILDWVNDKFDKDLSLDSLGTDSIDFEIPDLTNLSFAGNGNVFSAYVEKLQINTTRFEDIYLTLNTPTLVDSVLIGANVFDSNMTQLGNGNYDLADFDNNNTQDKNIVFYINNLTYGQPISTIALGVDTQLGDTKASEYVHYSKVLSFVDTLIDYVNGGEYAFTMNTVVNEYNIGANTTKLYAQVQDAFIELHNSPIKSTNEQTGEIETTQKLNIDYMYVNGKFTLPNNAKKAQSEYLTHQVESTLSGGTMYATYSNSMSNYANKLQLKISKSTLLKLIAVVAKVFDFDTSILTGNNLMTLPDVSGYDVTNLQYLFDVEPVDNTDFEKINNILETIGSYTDKLQSIEFVNRIVGGHEQSYLLVQMLVNDKTMSLMINLSDNKLTYLEAYNVQVTQTRNMQYIKLDVTNYKGTNSYNKSKSHFNLDGLDDLLTGLVNISTYDYYHITGGVRVSIDVPIVSDINLDVTFDVKVRLVETESDSGRIIKKPQVLVTANIPILKLGLLGTIKVNDDMDSGASAHTLNVYYYDGMMYTYRTESKSSKVYEKAVLQAAKDIDIMEYIQYVSGLGDTIMGYINDAMEQTLNRPTPIDVTNAINNYTYSQSGNTGKHNIIVNLAELAYNDMLDSGTINLYTGIHNGTRYADKADLNLYMPISKNLVEITISSLDSSNPIVLDFGSNLASSVNSAMNNALAEGNFVKLLDSWGADKYIERLGNSSSATWKKASDIEYTITFNTLCDTISAPSSITGTVGKAITLPKTLSSNTKTATIDNVLYTYQFTGEWTLDSTGNGEVVNWTTQPRGNKTLYAVWHVTDAKYLISYVTNSSYSVNGTRASAGTNITLPTISGVKNVDSGNVRYEYVFDKWYYDAELTQVANITTMPDHNITLYAGWRLNRTIHTYTVAFNSNGGTAYNSVTVVEGSTLDVSGYVPTKAEVKNNDWTSYKYLVFFTRYKHTHTRYTFEGWYTNSGLTNRFNGTVNSNLTLYAKYTQSSYTCDGHSSKSC